MKEFFPQSFQATQNELLIRFHKKRNFQKGLFPRRNGHEWIKPQTKLISKIDEFASYLEVPPQKIFDKSEQDGITRLCAFTIKGYEKFEWMINALVNSVNVDMDYSLIKRDKIIVEYNDEYQVVFPYSNKNILLRKKRVKKNDRN